MVGAYIADVTGFDYHIHPSDSFPYNNQAMYLTGFLLELAEQCQKFENSRPRIMPKFNVQQYVKEAGSRYPALF